MSLQTPDKIRTLQRKLYHKAKAEPDFRFYLLYDKIYREDILHHAYDLMRANNGAPGVDGVRFEKIEANGLEEWLAGIRKDLIEKTYRPAPVRRVMIPKPGGNGERPLGIPTIRDRTVQAAAKLVLEPIFEADLDPSAYGYRPKRGGLDAIKEVHALICRGYTDVVDADLAKYFDTIPHRELIQSVARRIVDRNILRLIRMWLRTPVEERDGDKRRMSGGRRSTCGTPQGGVVSPMLANVYMNRFLKCWRLSGRHSTYQAHIVSYADDFVILSRGHAEEALVWTRQVMARLGLALNELPMANAMGAVINILRGATWRSPAKRSRAFSRLLSRSSTSRSTSMASRSSKPSIMLYQGGQPLETVPDNLARTCGRRLLIVEMNENGGLLVADRRSRPKF